MPKVKYNINEKQKKENKVLLIGLILIVFSLGIIFLHPFQKIKNNSNPQNSNFSKLKNQDYSFITPNKVYDSLQFDLKKKYSLIDIRPSTDYTKEHIIDSVNIKPENFFKQAQEDKINVIITNFGNSQEFSSLWKDLNQKQKKSTRILKGGLTHWIKEGFPVVALGDTQSFVDQSKVQKISLEQFKNKIENKNTKNILITVIDIRPPQQFQISHIEGAKNIPFYELERRRKEISQDNLIIIYGQTKLQSFQYGVMLYDMGFNLVDIIKNDYNKDEWMKNGINITSKKV